MPTIITARLPTAGELLDDLAMIRDWLDMASAQIKADDLNGAAISLRLASEDLLSAHKTLAVLLAIA